MGISAAVLFIAPLLTASLAAQGGQLPTVVEKTLSNRMKILLVERAGGAVHARMFIQGGRADTGALPAGAADLLARSLFTRLLPEGLERSLAATLNQEGGSFEALRLDALRQARLPGAVAAPEAPNLKVMHDQALATLRERLQPVEAWDELDALGATRRGVAVEADWISYGLDLPASAIPAWCRLEAGRLNHLALTRFPLERERLTQELAAGAPPCPAPLAFLLATALAGHPYAQACDFSRAGLDALTWEDLKGLGTGLLSPDRLTLVLVGDFKAEAVLPLLERSFAGARSRPAEARRDAPNRFVLDDATGTLAAPGGKRLTVSTLGSPRLYLAWRVPPASHPDGPALWGLAQILGGSASSRLQRLAGPGGIARKLTVTLGVPGERDGNLLVIAAEPGEGRSLEELEQAIQGEILRITREPLAEPEARQAQVRMEAAQVLLQEDAGGLALALGAAHCQGGDWRLAFRALESGRDLKPSEIQAAARTYLVPARSTIAQFGPDPLLVPLDRTESRILQALTTLLQRKPQGDAQAQTVLREAMRQMRMLAPEEREHTLKLLEAQVNP